MESPYVVAEAFVLYLDGWKLYGRINIRNVDSKASLGSMKMMYH
jgi:hypothetical protein